MASKKIIDAGPVISKLAARALQAKGLECSLLGSVIDMLRAAPDIELSEKDAPYWATEAAYKNGYAAGKQDVTDINVGNKWIPVSERLPDKMGQYICRYVFGENTEYPFYQVLWYFAADGKPHFQHEGSMGLRVTHWIPFPAPPEEDD